MLPNFAVEMTMSDTSVVPSRLKCSLPSKWRPSCCSRTAYPSVVLPKFAISSNQQPPFAGGQSALTVPFAGRRRAREAGRGQDKAGGGCTGGREEAAAVHSDAAHHRRKMDVNIGNPLSKRGI